MKIPRYAKNVEQIVVSGPKKSIESAMSSGRSIARAGETVSGIGSMISKHAIERKRQKTIDEQNKSDLDAKIAEREKALKVQSDMSDYKLMREQLNQTLSTNETNALSSGEYSYADIPDGVTIPNLNEFEKTLDERGYSDEAIDKISEEWSLDREKIITKSRTSRNKRRILDMVERVKIDAYADINNGKDDEGYEKLETLSDVVGADEMTRLKNLGRYNKYTNIVSASNDVTAINDIINSPDAKKLPPQQFQALAGYVHSRTRKITSEEYAPAVKEFAKTLSSGQLTHAGIDAVQGLPENLNSFWHKKLDDDLTQNIVYKSEEYNKASGMVQKFLGGNYKGKKGDEFSNLLNDLGDTELPANVLAEVMDPITSSMGDPNTNKKFFDPKRGLQGYNDSQSVAFGEMVSVFEGTFGDKYAEIKVAGFGNAYREMWNFLKENPNYTKDDLNKKVREITSLPVSNYIQQSIREKNQSRTIVKVARDNDGKIIKVMYSDGTIEDAN